MTEREIHIPVYLKVIWIILGLFALFTILYITRSILVPLVFATIIAIVLHPVVNFFVRKKINRVLGIIITLLLTFIVLAAFGLLFISQASRFSESWPALVSKFTTLLNQTISDAASFYDKDPQKIHEWITKTVNDIINTSTEAIGKTLLTLGSVLMIILLLPVYIFLILFYHPLLIEFVYRLFGVNNKIRISQLVSQIKSVIQQYLIGLIFEFVIIAVLEITILIILGIEYALLLGILGALLNLIPYIGGLVAVAMPMVVALVTKTSPVFALYILIAYYLIQLIDNNYIVPKIVASKVKINALFSIIAVFAGNALWGIPGMFLSIPLLAIIKVIFDNIESLKPWGFLFGDTMPPMLKIAPILKKLKLK